MATTFSSMSFNTQFSNAQCVDPADIENFVDFSPSLPSPVPTSSNGKAPMHLSRSISSITSPTATSLHHLDFEEQQVPMKPSHEYERFKQQTGIPTDSYGALTSLQGGFVDYSASGLGNDIGLGSSSMFSGMGSNTGLDIDGDMQLGDLTPATDLPPYFFPSSDVSSSFVNPSSISQPQQQTQHVRLYPGMHQQAAMAKAQQEAQEKLQAPKRRPSEQGRSGRKSLSPVDARTEETIARVVNQIRQNNASSYAQDADSPPPMSAHFSRSRKDEDDMDEDERLLASEEGKKLSSKERRQLRNKVSARAFRSRRKEYISQMEGEVQSKINEMNDLKVQNRALLEENAGFRELTVKLLRHPAFTPFLEDISRDPSLGASLSKVWDSMGNTAALSESSASGEEAESQSVQPQQTTNLHIGMATIPETQLDLAALNLNANNNWAIPGMNDFGFQQPQVFVVAELPESPVTLEQELAVIKGEESIIERFTPVQDAKAEVSVMEKPVSAITNQKAQTVDESVELDADFELYNDVPTRASKRESMLSEPLITGFASEKIFGYELVVAEDADILERRLSMASARCERLCSSLEHMSKQFE